MDELAIPAVVLLHVEEAALLRHVRSTLVRGAHITLPLLARADERLAAHLDGVMVAADLGWRLTEAALATPNRGALFTAAVLAIGRRDDAALDKLFTLAEASPEAGSELVSAFGWSSAQDLRGTTKRLLDATDASMRSAGLAACAMHRVDPGPVLGAALAQPDAGLRRRALQVAGHLGRVDLLPACLGLLDAVDERQTFHAARAALLLGDRGESLRALQRVALAAGELQAPASNLLLRAVPVQHGNALLKSLAKAEPASRLLLQAVGVNGDPAYVPWLIRQMDEPRLARLAGEAMTAITGVDIVERGLAANPPAAIDSIPNDDPDDERVAMDEDESLPWPDAEKAAAWWAAQAAGFEPGTRCFMGAPPSAARCTEVLAHGGQRQRAAAAMWLAVMRPGAKVFETAAPAWRQRRWLAMGDQA